MGHKRIYILSLLGLSLLGLASCGDNKQAALKKYVEEVKHRPAPAIEPLPEVKPYVKLDYDAEDKRSPFVPYVNLNAASGPNNNRKKDYLEAYPLDSLRMVGILEEDRKTWALIKAPDGTVDKITVGGYIGQNFGKVERISPNGLELTETIPQGDDWVQRNAKLALSAEDKEESSDREK